MAKKGIEVTVRRIPLEAAIDGVEPMEIATLVSMVEKRMEEIADRTGAVDTLKLAIMAAMEFAAEVYLKGSDSSAQRKEETERLDEIILKLQSTMNRGLPTGG